MRFPGPREPRPPDPLPGQLRPPAHLTNISHEGENNSDPPSRPKQSKRDTEKRQLVDPQTKTLEALTQLSSFKVKFSPSGDKLWAWKSKCVSEGKKEEVFPGVHKEQRGCESCRQRSRSTKGLEGLFKLCLHCPPTILLSDESNNKSNLLDGL